MNSQDLQEVRVRLPGRALDARAAPNNDLEQTRRRASEVAGHGRRPPRAIGGSWWGVQLKSNSLESVNGI